MVKKKGYHWVSTSKNGDQKGLVTMAPSKNGAEKAAAPRCRWSAALQIGRAIGRGHLQLEAASATVSQNVDFLEQNGGYKNRHYMTLLRSTLISRTILVGGLEHFFYFSIDWEFHHPNWRTHIFQRVETTKQMTLLRIEHALSILIMVKPWWVLEIAKKSAGEWRVEDWLLAFILIEYPAKHYLVGGLFVFLFFHILEIFGNNNSNWLTHNFQGVGQPPTSYFPWLGSLRLATKFIEVWIQINRTWGLATR